MEFSQKTEDYFGRTLIFIWVKLLFRSLSSSQVILLVEMDEREREIIFNIFIERKAHEDFL